MWSLETLKQINKKHAELGRDQRKPVSAAQVYVECGISVNGSASDKPSEDNKRENVAPVVVPGV